MPDLLSFNPGGVQFAWDSTSISNYAKCPRYYQLVNLEGWQPIEKSVHLLFGGWYAKALEDYYVLTTAGTSHLDAVREIVRRTLIRTGGFTPKPGATEYEYREEYLEGEFTPWESLHNTKTRETLIRSIVWYFEQFGDDDSTEIVIIDNKPAVELSFSIPIGEDTLYCGHIDRLVTFGEETFVMDQKTSGSTISKNFFDGFKLDYQMSGYTFAGTVLFETPVSGVIIDAAQIAVGFTEFSRGFVHKPRPLIEEWLEIIKGLISDAQASTEMGSFRPNYTACDKYGGCQFRKICSRIPEHRSRALEADFIQRPRWDPLKKR